MKPIIGLVAVGLLLSQVALANQFYRFKVDGRTVLKDYLPAEYADLGYEVLNSRGMVIEVVEPAPTPEERAATAAREAAKLAREQAIENQRKEDLVLLRLYSRPEDVERARQRRTLELDSYIQLQRRNIADLAEKLEAEQNRAANIERNGREVPANVRTNIVQLQNGIKDSERNITQRQRAMSELTQQMAQQYERIRILQVYKPGVLPEDIDLEHVDRTLSKQQP